MIATFISRFFDPFAMLAIIFILLFYDSPVFIPAFCLMIVLPFSLFVLAWKTKWISNWDIKDRKERPKILWSLVLIECIAVIFFQLWHLAPILFGMAGFGVITHFWKISGHVMSVGLAAGLLVTRMGFHWWPVLLAVPLMCWSRVVTKNHTMAQVIAGAIYAFFIVFLYEAW